MPGALRAGGRPSHRSLGAPNKEAHAPSPPPSRPVLLAAIGLYGQEAHLHRQDRKRGYRCCLLALTWRSHANLTISPREKREGANSNVKMGSIPPCAQAMATAAQRRRDVPREQSTCYSRGPIRGPAPSSRSEDLFVPLGEGPSAAQRTAGSPGERMHVWKMWFLLLLSACQASCCMLRILD